MDRFILYKPNGLLSRAHFAKLANHVNYINVMTYDYHFERFVGVAPFEWVRFNLEYVLSSSPGIASKILMGVNFYGYVNEQNTMKAVTGKDYLEFLNSNWAALEWNSVTKEHLLKTGNHGMCFYPTTVSLKARLELADVLDVGIGIWELGQGLNYFTCLL
ncbi:unnamed protein product [Gongylonema pulchrum]|uniref:Chitinase domain-containing protein 1 n=1 Tax=Gongylonema pulchrum TaxID=637853 RepID=A0A183D0M6_9BILA|nr:unnamed protein product [Gongylonema pulchrum]